MDISVSHRNGVVWELKGDLDYQGARVVRDAAKRLQKDCEPLVVDLSGVPFVDSAGLAALIGLSRRIAETGGNVVVVGARRSILRLLRITGVDRRVEVRSCADDEDPATATSDGSFNGREFHAARW
jgi:anti-sigma B factor antagonist